MWPAPGVHQRRVDSDAPPQKHIFSRSHTIPIVCFKLETHLQLQKATRALTIMPTMDPLQLFDLMMDETDQTTFLQLFSSFCRHSSNDAVALKPSSWFKRESILPPLPEVWRNTAADVLAQATFTNIKVDNLRESSLQLLRPGNMLDHELVEAYIGLIRQEGASICSTRLFDSIELGTPQQTTDLLIDYQQVCHRVGSLHLEQAEADEIVPSFRYRILAELLAGTLDPSVTEHERFVSQTVRDQSAETADDTRDLIPKGSLDEDSISVDSTQPRSSQLRKEKHDGSSFVDTCVKSFASEKSMLEILNLAVRFHRVTKPDVITDQGLDFLYHKVENDDHAQDILRNRHYREQYSRMFYRSLKQIGGTSFRADNWVRAAMQQIMRLPPDTKLWKAAQSHASRSTVWAELLDIFQGHLDFPCTALCGTCESTAAIEGLSRKSRDLFFLGLRHRLQDPADGMLKNLKAASALARALLYNHLPDFTLAIERKTDLDLMDFEAAVSVEEKLRLPSGY
ncbi:uncharacterized protein LY89DRAFT_784932 [Mollisia scopiformis]|uniref:Uncharacterized protein n=1 Tax=Mollisia scopiformis TaxID=149040 RepID=A0A194WYY0_MOLSC|nr:uncharacterized protein LY89DRAFT_784932 [Mollisia scopiformis]KUJ13171.1 hypothetical protein LY89DRAFT_784932 [Mollisia scopiformis]